MVMTEERKTMLRMLLEQEMRQITERAQSDLRPVREAYSQKTGDLADRASHEDGVSIQATILNMKGATAHKLQIALQRLNEGTFGQCDACGQEIPEARLAAVVFAERCITCQEKREAASGHQNHSQI